MAYLSRSSNLLTLLRDRLEPQDGQATDPLIESVVVNYLLTTIYADLEINVRSILTAYGAKATTDVRVNTFLEAAVKRVVRSIKCKELAGALNMFDTNCKKHFQAEVNDKPSQLAYDRIVAGRHDQSHSLGSDMTLAEVGTDIVHCEAILREFEQALTCSCEH